MNCEVVDAAKGSCAEKCERGKCVVVGDDLRVVQKMRGNDTIILGPITDWLKIYDRGSSTEQFFKRGTEICKSTEWLFDGDIVVELI